MGEGVSCNATQTSPVIRAIGTMLLFIATFLMHISSVNSTTETGDSVAPAMPQGLSLDCIVTPQRTVNSLCLFTSSTWINSLQSSL